MSTKQWTYLGICDAGCYGKIGDNTSITTYDPRLEKYYHELADGGIVIDKRPAMKKDASACIHGVVSGPMLKQSLPPKTKDSWGDIQHCESARECRSMDYVSTDLYLAYWRDLGARIGKRQGHTIQWEDGTMEWIRTGE